MKIIFYNIILTALLIGGGLACAKNNQRAEADILIGETNQMIGEAIRLSNKTEFRNRKLFDADIQTVEELEAYRIKMKGEAQEIIADYEKISKLLADISKKFDAAAQMNVAEDYREYSRTKSEEFAKRAEAYQIRKGNAQAFIEIESPPAMNDKFDKNNSLFEKLIKEADGLSNLAKQTESEKTVVFTEFKTPDTP